MGVACWGVNGEVSLCEFVFSFSLKRVDEVGKFGLNGLKKIGLTQLGGGHKGDKPDNS